MKETDILERLADLHKQATMERSHYYTGKVIMDAIHEIGTLRLKLAKGRKAVDWSKIPEVISPDELALFYKNAQEDV